jgi:hypothetical protein
MPEFLKGNYKVDVTIEDKADIANSTDEFEKKALSRLGGSICFVSKKGLMWQGAVQPVAGAGAGGEATTRTASRATPKEAQAAASRANPANGDKDTAGGAGTKNRPGA